MLRPKITGTQVLAKVLADEVLDFTVYFSSSSALLGDFGSCAYAVANRFQLAYGRYHNALVINWPLWQSEGMSLGSEDSTRLYLGMSGQALLTAEQGLKVFDYLLTQPTDTPYLLMVGDASKINRLLGVTPCAKSVSALPERVTDAKITTTFQPVSLQVRVEQRLTQMIAEHLNLAENRLNRTTNLADFGFDSMGLTAFARQLSQYFGINLTPSVFFGYSTIAELSAYLLENHGNAIEDCYKQRSEPQSGLGGIPTQSVGTINTMKPVEAMPLNTDDAIAIIGMSGRFPGADTVDEFWQNLKDGVNTVGEMPSQRGSATAGLKAGFINGVAEFDPLFFELSPAEAETIDPRQRLLLQEAWNALEDAAIGPLQLAQQKIGMFVGVEEGEYQRLVNDASVTANHTGVLATRLAYFLNLRGPVMAINTSCSSGLVAVHQACQSLKLNECDAAVAAAVNLMLLPESFNALTQAGMLAKDGQCRAFSANANGMIPGEAVVAVVLKPLAKAQADGDPVIAVIRASGLNYDGKTNGITAPNGLAQAELINDIYRRAGIQAKDIRYIVAHGTGTPLGDPVEVNALTQVFKQQSDQTQYCALTSNKTNIGHSFAASGLVNLVNLTLALQQQQIPASLHCTDENPHIDWPNSPFYVNKQTKVWQVNADELRLGAVSAFGMSGTNAHVVVQEYRAPATPVIIKPGYLFVLSAKTESALRLRVKAVAAYLVQHKPGNDALATLSYSLLVGRHHFAHRLALVVVSVEQLTEVLTQFYQIRG
ncbi:beta-ketoacyl synthase N-terminal-like domain-containing protein [Methylocucumis oryzae]|uniref:beta-ketoacyl synthase N-terminal-like domain-containing protein n=1 Tax=Methylocucumis oryzae TaxID=1632867 RepID=UPI000695EEB7|nr:beta-ketoacyl synthase N-terminal-like domain-containing protein [Methylocucumis oryzae]